MRPIKFLIAILISCHLSNALSQITLDSTTIDTSTVISGLDIPWEIKWGPDDWIWVTERYGRVSRINPETGIQDVVLDLSSQVHQELESGMLGMEIDPNFNDTPWVYLVYTYFENSIFERLVRYEYNDTILINPKIIIDSITGNRGHDGSRLLILPDNTILMSTGDALFDNLAQDFTSLNGKMLRFNLDGTIPNDNPFPGNPIWSWGHRNPQGLTLGPNGNIYSSEHGPTSDDELNLLEKGRNFGWPLVFGFCDGASEMQVCNDSNIVEPLLNWTPTVATSDIIWYNHLAIPEFQNSILLTTLKRKNLVRIRLNKDGTEAIDEWHYFNEVWGRLRDICVSPDGAIYLATNGSTFFNSAPFTHSIVKLENKSFVLGDPEKISSKKIELWPNPTLGIINTNADQTIVKDISGKTILISAENVIDLSTIPRGIYFILSKIGNQYFHSKVIKH